MERGTSRSSSSLPPGWVAIMDPATGREYYANPDTRETRWDPPSSPQHSSSSLRHTPPDPVRGNEDRSETSHYNSQEQHNDGFGGGIRSRSASSTNAHPTLPRRDDGNKDYQEQFQSVIPAAREMFDKIVVSSSVDDDDDDDEKIMLMKSSDLELKSLSVGQIADLCHIQRTATKDRLDKDGISYYYVPLNPYQMSQHRSSSHMDVLDTGGIDMRLFALNAKLQHYRAEPKRETMDV